MTDNNYPLLPLNKRRACPLCGHCEHRVLGVRGNREYHGADPHAQPHIWTHVVNCKQCDFIFTDPDLIESDQLEKKFYNNPQLYKAVPEDISESMFNKRLDLIKKYSPAGRLLDVGAGKGEFLVQAQLAGWKVEGIEPSVNFCEYARDHFGIPMHAGTLGNISEIQAASYDVITLNHVLEHVYPPIGFLKKISQYLKPEGILYIEVPNVQSYLAKLIDVYFRLRGRPWSCRLSPVHPPFHKYGYSQRSLTYTLLESGFAIEKFVTFSGRDRGIRKIGETIETQLRKVAFTVFENLGNREILGVICRPK